MGGTVALIAGGCILIVLALLDLFLTVFNFDGFTFIAGRFQNGLWQVIRRSTGILPARARAAALAFGSATMLPATVVMWLTIEVLGFGLLYLAGLEDHGLAVTHGLGHDFGSALYLSAGAISTLTLGDIVPTAAFYRAACDLEAMVGLATFTLSLGYVVTTFNVLSDLDSLHNTVRLHAEDPGRPSSILARHYRGGEPSELPDLLQNLSESLESYDEGLRRYPVVYYFHTRRAARSVPRVFWTLGELLALIRWGLPDGEPMTEDPWLAALLDQYTATVERLQRSFVGPWPGLPLSPLDRDGFVRQFELAQPSDEGVRAFVSLQRRARRATGMDSERDENAAAAYRRYEEWLPFACRRDLVLDRVSDRLGYDADDVRGSVPGPPADVAGRVTE